MTNPFSSSVEDSYNPFAAAADTPAPAFNDPSPFGASGGSGGYTNDTPQSYTAPTPSYTSPAPAASSSGGQFKDHVTGANISDKDLSIREQELARREREIASKETQIASGTYKKPETRKNFPFGCCGLWEYYPELDLPEDSRSLMNWVKWCYIAMALALFVNAVGSLFCLAPGPSNKVDSVATIIIISWIFAIIFVPISFESSFFVGYNALKDGKGMKFFCFLTTMVIWWGVNVFMIIGIWDWVMGWIQCFSIFGADKNTWVGVIALIYDIMATVAAVGMAWFFIQLCRYWKNVGLDKKAFGEASKMAADYARENPDQAMAVASTVAQTSYN